MWERTSLRNVRVGPTIAVAAIFCLSLAHASSNLTVIYSFTNGSDGNDPNSPVVMDALGNLYGEAGGGKGYGVVFELKPCSRCRGRWAESTIYSFGNSGLDGYEPIGGLVLSPSGIVYGVTHQDGAYSQGTVFGVPIVSSNDGTIHSFGSGNSGGFPYGGLVQDMAGNLFGTTSSGGTSDSGTVFELTFAGGKWNYQVIHNFGPTNGTDGYYPFGALAVDPSGEVYGTTYEGGVYGWGTVFELAKVNGEWTETRLYDFTGGDNGGLPLSGVILDANKNIYGTTSSGGEDNVGTVFQLALSRGRRSHHVLHSFTGGEDGGLPAYGSLARDAAGNLYGTTKYGGRFQFGTLFELTKSHNSRRWKETVLHSFGGGQDGGNPLYGVLIDSTGRLYGTAPVGGADNWGLVFQYTK